MELWSQLQWQQPWWLLLGISPWLLLQLGKRLPPKSQLEKFIAPHLWPWLLTGRPEQQKIPPHFIAAWLLASTALAGPFLSNSPANSGPDFGANIAVIVDISPSMGVADVAPNRLQHSKYLLNEFSRQLGRDRLALIAFSANAYTVLPLTSDKSAFRHFLNALDPSLVTVTGSNLSHALRLAREALDAPTLGQSAPGLVLLVSDGEIHDQDAINTSRQLLRDGHRLHTLGVGTEEGGPVSFASGRLLRQQDEIIISQRQRPTLQALAAAGGGQYFDLHPDAWPKIMAEIAELRQRQPAAGPTQQDRLLYPWFLALALAIFIWHGLRRPALIALILAAPLFMTTGTDSEAAPWDEAIAMTHLQKGEIAAAREIYSRFDNYTGQMGLGVAAYQDGDWDKALEAFEHAYTLAETDQQKAHAAYNRGNTLVQLGRIDAAIDAFKTALERQPGYPKAAHNLTLLNKPEVLGGTRRSQDSQHQRSGAGKEEDTKHRGDEAASTNTPESSPQASASKKAGQQQHQQALQQSLEQWSKLPEQSATGNPANTQAWQQLNNLTEEQQTMLKRRFAIEDQQATLLVQEKPW